MTMSKPLRSHAIYHTWVMMRYRCNNPKHIWYKHYGGRGIKVCKRWSIADRSGQGFLNFLADMGEKPTKDHQIDRKDNSLGYSPENCKWSTPKENSSNKRNNVIYKGEHATDASRRLTNGKNKMLVNLRIKQGWTIEKSFTEKVRFYNKRQQL